MGLPSPLQMFALGLHCILRVQYEDEKYKLFLRRSLVTVFQGKVLKRVFLERLATSSPRKYNIGPGSHFHWLLEDWLCLFS